MDSSLVDPGVSLDANTMVERDATLRHTAGATSSQSRPADNTHIAQSGGPITQSGSPITQSGRPIDGSEHASEGISDQDSLSDIDNHDVSQRVDQLQAELAAQADRSELELKTALEVQTSKMQETIDKQSKQFASRVDSLTNLQKDNFDELYKAYSQQALNEKELLRISEESRTLYLQGLQKQQTASRMDHLDTMANIQSTLQERDELQNANLAIASHGLESILFA